MYRQALPPDLLAVELLHSGLGGRLRRHRHEGVGSGDKQRNPQLIDIALGAYRCRKYSGRYTSVLENHFPSGHRHHSGHLAMWAKLGLNGLLGGEAEHKELSHLV